MQFAVDVKQTEERFRELSRLVHPDKFAKADPRARKASLQRSVQLNEAWRTLKDPVRRAMYLLKLCGYDVAAEAGASAPGEAPGEVRRLPVSPVLLGDILELREALGDARAAGDRAKVATLAADVRERIGVSMRAVEAGFASALDREPDAARSAAQSKALDVVAGELIAVRYYNRFLEEVPEDAVEVTSTVGGVA